MIFQIPLALSKQKWCKYRRYVQDLMCSPLNLHHFNYTCIEFAIQLSSSSDLGKGARLKDCA